MSSHPNSAITARPNDIRALMGARALPPLILLLFHFCEQRGYSGIPAFDMLVGKGYLWVEFFFCLSGFILIYVYGAQARQLFQLKHYLRFIVTRVARLYPLYLAALLLLLALVLITRAIAPMTGIVSIFDQPYHPIVSVTTFFANLFMVQNWHLFPYLSWNAPAWFVSVILLVYLAFPLFAYLSRATLRRGLLILALGMAALAALTQFYGLGLDITYQNGIWRGFAGFTCGVGLAVIFRNLRKLQADYTLNVIQLGVLALLFCALYYGGPARTPNDMVVVAFEMVLIFVLAFDRGIVARIFQTKPFILLGEWSYGIYLLQFPMIQLLRTLRQYYPAEWRPLGLHSSEVFWIEIGLLMLATIALSALLTRTLEQPINHYMRRRLVLH